MNVTTDIISLLIPGFAHIKKGKKRMGALIFSINILNVLILAQAILRGKFLWFNNTQNLLPSVILLFLLFLSWSINIYAWNLNKLGKDGGGEGYWSLVQRRFLRNRRAIAGFIIIIVIVYIAVFAPLISPYGYLNMDLMNTLAKPSILHPLGTDNFGRDIASRIIYGSRIALGVGTAATLFNMGVGGLLGLLAGFYKGFVDSTIMRILETINAIPYFVLMLLVISLFGGGIVNLILVLGIFGLYPARIIRSEVLSVREEDYVEASEAVGASNGRIVFRHVLPNSVASLLVTTTMRIGLNIILVAGLSFLGAGLSPPTPSWGAMLQKAQTYMRTAWWMAIFPGLAIVVLVLGFNIFGDGLRDVLDPKLK